MQFSLALESFVWFKYYPCSVCYVQVWACEFCGQENKVEVEAEEVPTKKDTTYLIAPPMPIEGEAGVGGVDMEASLVIFCIDISGSMCVTVEVSKRVWVWVWVWVWCAYGSMCVTVEVSKRVWVWVWCAYGSMCVTVEVSKRVWCGCGVHMGVCV